MAYQQKYYFNFVSLDGHTNRVEIWQNTSATLTPVEIDSLALPFSIELPAIKDKFQPVRGSGCEINILSASNFQFFTGLYHVDKKEIIIKHYIDGSINWLGYLDSELIRERYDYLTNYPFQITGNDGFSLLDRIQFLQGASDTTPGGIYTGVKSLFDIMTIIINRIGELPFSEILISLSTTSPLFIIGSNETVLHKVYVDTANFIKEDGTAETMRKVLESILQPFGAFIFQDKGNIRIVDVNNMASGTSFSTQVYSWSWTLVGSYYVGSWNFVNTITENPSKSISDIGYMGTGQEIEQSGGKNKQVVGYSPYPIKTWLPGSLNRSSINNSEFTFVDLSWSVRNQIYYKVLTGNSFWDSEQLELVNYYNDPIYHYSTEALMRASTSSTARKANTTYITDDYSYHWRWNGATYVLTDPTLTFGSAQDIHMVIRALRANTLSASLKINPYVTIPKGNYTLGTVLPGGVGLVAQIVKGAMIEIKGGIQLVKWVSKPPITILQDSILSHVILTMKVKIGNYFYNGSIWTLTDSFFNPRISNVNDSPYIGSEWNYIGYPNYYAPKLYKLGNLGVDGIYIPIDQDLSGALSVEFWSDFHQDGGINNTAMADKFDEAWLSNLSVNIVQSDLTQIPDASVEYIGYLDPTYKNEAEKVELICGTMTSITDRGKLLYNASGIMKAVTTFIRGGQTDRIETLLLNSLVSNSRTGYYTLTNMKLANSFTQFAVLTDTFTGTKVFMITAMKTNFRDNIIESTLVEISPDELTIV